MQILVALINHFRRKPDLSKIDSVTLKPPKPTKVQKHQAKELADAKMALAKCETAEEYYRFQAEMYRATIDRIEGAKGIELRMLDIGVSQ